MERQMVDNLKRKKEESKKEKREKKEQVRDDIRHKVKGLGGHVNVPVPVHVRESERVCVAPALINEARTTAFRN